MIVLEKLFDCHKIVLHIYRIGRVMCVHYACHICDSWLPITVQSHPQPRDNECVDSIFIRSIIPELFNYRPIVSGFKYTLVLFDTVQIIALVKRH